ncbi:MAG: DUF5074 domain-containing protein, partial [Tannerellaceae bacterium]|nr:DUF5074 domain-containing protein [Tannerellaceae bacterium]
STPFANGVFFLNEESYPDAGSLNFLRLGADGRADAWDYNVYRTANAGRHLGTTAQYGVGYHHKLFFIHKQPGAYHLTAVRVDDLTACDTVWTADGLPASDGRFYLPLSDTSGLEATSRGLLFYDFVHHTITPVPSVPLAPEPVGFDCVGQLGTLRLVGDRIFAVRQDTGILVLNARTLALDTILTGHRDTTITSTPTSLYASHLHDNAATAIHTLLHIDPYTLVQTPITIPNGVPTPASDDNLYGTGFNHWSFWHADPISAIPTAGTDTLCWILGNTAQATALYRFDPLTATGDIILRLDTLTIAGEQGWHFYASGFGFHPETGELFAALQQGYSDSWAALQFDVRTGNVIATLPLAPHGWYTAMPVFADPAASEQPDGKPVVPGDEPPSALFAATQTPPAAVHYADGILHIHRLSGYTLQVSALNGRPLAHLHPRTDTEQFALPLSPGIYILHALPSSPSPLSLKFLVPTYHR